MAPDHFVVGTIASLWRYPVKSMQGQELNASEVTERGLLGDRAFALIDDETGRVASAKNPRIWPDLFSFRAAFIESPRGHNPLPSVRITLPDGTSICNEQGDRDPLLGTALGRRASLQGLPAGSPLLEEYWPNLEGLSHRDVVTEEQLPPGTFFDLAAVHLLTTATIDQLRKNYPEGRFEVRRFRPNIVVACDGEAKGFIEQSWVGRTLALGDGVWLKVTGPCPRCVMTTLPQGDLPGDVGILRAAVQHNQGHVGVYARVMKAGTVRRGDNVRLLEETKS